MTSFILLTAYCMPSSVLDRIPRATQNIKSPHRPMHANHVMGPKYVCLQIK